MRKKYIICMMAILGLGAVGVHGNPLSAGLIMNTTQAKFAAWDPVKMLNNTAANNATSMLSNTSAANTSTDANLSVGSTSATMISAGLLKPVSSVSPLTINTAGKQVNVSGIGQGVVNTTGASNTSASATTLSAPAPVTTAGTIATPIELIPVSARGFTLSNTETINHALTSSDTTASTDTMANVNAGTRLASGNTVIGSGLGGGGITNGTVNTNTGLGVLSATTTGSTGGTVTASSVAPTSVATLTVPSTTATLPPVTATILRPVLVNQVTANTTETNGSVRASSDTSATMDASTHTHSFSDIVSDGRHLMFGNKQNTITDSSQSTTTAASGAVGSYTTGADGVTLSSTINTTPSA